MEPLVVIPYSNNKSIDFYEDRFYFGKHEIPYESVKGFTYSNTHTTSSIMYIPVANSTRISFSIDDGSRKIKTFNKEIVSGFMYKGKGQVTVSTVFSELVHCLHEYIAPIVFRKLVDEIVEYGSVEVGGLNIYINYITKKGFFKEKQLFFYEYGNTTIEQGMVYVRDSDGKIFHSVVLGYMNAPILSVLLGTMANWNNQNK